MCDQGRDESISASETKRMKTRNQAALEIDEEINQLRAAEKEGIKGLKKYLAKLKAEVAQLKDHKNVSEVTRLMNPPYEPKEKQVRKSRRGLRKRSSGRSHEDTLEEEWSKRNKDYKWEKTEAILKPLSKKIVEVRGSHWFVGDIVVMKCSERNMDVYAQIRGFYSDQFCEYYAAVNWLMPRVNNIQQIVRNGFFSPTMFHRGPMHDVPINLRCVKYLVHVVQEVDEKDLDNWRK